MAINYTPTSHITARITTSDGYSDPLQEEEVAVLAFGWVDVQPEKATGVWVLGAKTSGVTFIPAKSIQRLDPCTPKVEAALERTEAIAVRALDLASELQVKMARAMQEVQVAEGVAVGAMEVAIETAEEAQEERDEAEKAAAKSRSGAGRSAARSSASSKATNRRPARRGRQAKA